MIVVGVVSDTHGQLPARVKALLQGVDHIVHAGDIGSETVLAELRAIAPVTAVRGNCDTEVWARALPVRAELELGGVHILVGHIASALRVGMDSQVVVTGHSHVAALERRGSILYLNPGSAGPQRFGRQRSIARLVIEADCEDQTGTPPGAEPGAQPGARSRARIDAEILNAEAAQG